MVVPIVAPVLASVNFINYNFCIKKNYFLCGIGTNMLVCFL